MYLDLYVVCVLDEMLLRPACGHVFSQGLCHMSVLQIRSNWDNLVIISLIFTQKHIL